MTSFALHPFLLRLHSFLLSSRSTIAAVVISFVFICFALSRHAKIKAPVVGYRFWLEPAFLVRFRFLFNAKAILTDGYCKHKNDKFLIRRNDTDILVMANTFLEELRPLPRTVLSNVRAQYQNLLGDYTYASIIMKSDLHIRVLRNELTPRLGFYIERAKAEFDHYFEHDFAQANGNSFPVVKLISDTQISDFSLDWTEVDIQSLARLSVARMTGAVFLGNPLCRSDEWLRISVQYPIDTLKTAFIMRIFPSFMHPIISRILPSRRRIRGHLKDAEKLIAPLIESRLTSSTYRGADSETILDWMVDNASGTEAETGEMTSRQLILTVASIHTTALALTQALFDICAHQEFLGPIREEIEAVKRDYKGITFLHRGLSQLVKLDSFLAESQRFHPPILMAPQRVALASITLRDGTYIPRGTRIGFPAYNLLMDPALTPDPDKFDGFRAYRNCNQVGNRRQNFMVQTDKNHLGFGHGNQACPGRFFAVAELKIMLARILTVYDLKFVGGTSRPDTWVLDENCFPDPSAKLLLRRRVA